MIVEVQLLASDYKKLRKDAGLTQCELSQSTGISQPKISQVERGNLEYSKAERFIVEFVCAAAFTRTTQAGKSGGCD